MADSAVNLALMSHMTQSHFPELRLPPVVRRAELAEKPHFEVYRGRKAVRD
jgi:hypothetical protein